MGGGTAAGRVVDALPNEEEQPVRNLQTGALIAATLSTGLMAGLFAAFAYAVMPGLARSSDHAFVEVMRNINKAILNPVFMLPFLGAIPLLGLAVVLAWRGHGRSALPWLIAALVLYVVAFLVTSAVNVPLNDQLAHAGGLGGDAQWTVVRADFERAWVRWNVVRAVLHAAAFGCLMGALLVHGAHRPVQGGRGEDARTSAPELGTGHARAGQLAGEIRSPRPPFTSSAER
ncbi:MULTISPECIES: anthrone oxygenase family protein [unclassified Streptomyces]|uniref:anthrone oxygenase family protein n=1 Tax=unclassified Streptomyces TaxID=2593676 RepID=UPI0027DAA683|nr:MULTISPECIES: anthrone oxygenase family protein [unclassified Streptomyces]